MPEKSSRQVISKEKADFIKEKIKNLKPKNRESLHTRDLIEAMREEIKNALTIGYTYEDIITMIKEEDMVISLPTIKKYMSEKKTEDINASTATKTSKKGKKSIHSRNEKEQPSLSLEAKPQRMNEAP